jgi:Fe-S cluster assembly scaffold protein SufB
MNAAGNGTAAVTDSTRLLRELLDSIGRHSFAPGVAHVEIHGNRVLRSVLVPGLLVESEEQADGVSVKIRVTAGTVLEQPVQFCFGMVPAKGLQRITLETHIEENARATFVASCTFPNAVEVRHVMDADVTVEKGAELVYSERHVHGPAGGVVVVPKTRVRLFDGARFSSDFQLTSGRAGEVDIDYQVDCGFQSVAEMKVSMFGRGDDRIRVYETAVLNGAESRAVLTSHLALTDDAQAEIVNEIEANASESRGHVDCKEILHGRGKASAIPIVRVNDPRAHVTHEAAIGSVDSRQLQTLLARGLDEEAATEMIIQGLLR